MKPVYSDLSPKRGVHVAGICSIQIVPREWLETPIAIDFTTGKVIVEVDLVADKEWINLGLLEESYDYDEKPKSSKSGSFFEVAAGGVTNDLSPEILQTLETFRYHEFIAILKDKQQRYRIVGDQDAGMVLQFASSQGNILKVDISLQMQTEAAPPYYEV
jgi:hypothetical protein